MPRVRIPVIGPTYRHRQLPLSAQVTKNLWPEINQDARNVVALHNTAGLKPFSILGGADRGVHKFNDVMYAVSGTALYRVPADGDAVNLGNIAGTERCVMADDGYQLVIVNSRQPYIYNEDGLRLINDPVLVNPTSVAYLNGHFVFDTNRGNQGEFVTSSLLTQDFDVDPLDFATAESHPDDIGRIYSFNGFIWFFGYDTLEIWFNTGVGRPPFERGQSGTKPYGIAGTYAACNTEEWVYWLDQKRIPRRSQGTSVQHIGNPSLGIEFDRYNRIDDCICFTYTQDAQNFVVYTFPTADRSWVFHEPSGNWFQWAWGVTEKRARASSAMDIYGLNFVADHSNGEIYELDPCWYLDDDVEIQRQRDTHIIHGGLFDQPGMRMYFDTVEFVFAHEPCLVQGTGPRVPPTTTVTGVCGTIADVDPDDYIAVTPMFMVGLTSEAIESSDPTGDGIELTDSKIVSFTVGFTTDVIPSASDPQRSAAQSPLLEVFDSDNSRQAFAVYIDDDGFLQVLGRNAAGTVILSATITNEGGTFIDSAPHLVGFVCELDDATHREVFVDGVEVTAAYVTWTTYTDDLIDFSEDTNAKYYVVAGGYFAHTSSGYLAFTADNGAASSGFDTGLRGWQMLSLDNTCGLICSAMWDTNGLIRSPGKDYLGWYMNQPKWAFSTTTLISSGSADTAMRRDMSGTVVFGNDFMDNPQDTTQFNWGAGGTIAPTGFPGSSGTGLPPPAETPQIETEEPLYENALDGNWIDLNAQEAKDFKAKFGSDPGGIPFAGNFTDINGQYPFNVPIDGTYIEFPGASAVNPSQAQMALFVTNEDGDILARDVSTHPSTPCRVLLPSGGSYILVISTDTEDGYIRMRNDFEVPDFLGETYTFESFFGASQITSGAGLRDRENYKFLSSYGAAIRFYFKSGRAIKFTPIDDSQTGAGIVSLSVSQYPGDHSGNAYEVRKGAAGGSSIDVEDLGIPPGWYWVNFRIDNYGSVAKPVTAELQYFEQDA